MTKCLKCRIEIIDGIVCKKCGCFINDDVVAEATREDNIKVLSNLMMKIRAVESADKKLKEFVTPPKPAFPVEKTFWGCYWPYLIGSIVAGNILAFFVPTVGVIALFIVGIGGIFLARAKRNEYNNSQMEYYSQRLEESKKFPTHSELLAAKEKCMKELEPFKEYIPGLMMKSVIVKELVNIISRNEANTISEAIEVYKNK